MKLRRIVRSIQRAFRTAGRPSQRILVASVPRCGSTLLVRSIGVYGSGSRSPKKAPDFAFVRDLNQIPDKPYLKTHSPAPETLPGDVRAIFLFGDPVDAVVSTRNKRFDKIHFGNCGYFEDAPPEIYDRDDLGYENIFDTWMTPREYPVLAMRYEKMFDHKKWLDDFLGFEVELEPFRKRTTQVEPQLRRKLERVYGSLIEKVNQAPDVAILENCKP